MRRIEIYYTSLILLLCLFTLQACKKAEDSTRKKFAVNEGEIKILVDDTYTQLAGELIKSYENVYDSAHIIAESANEEKVFAQFMQDSVQLILTGRMLRAGEIAMATEKQGIPPRENIIAYDAIAVVHAAESKDSIFDLDAFAANRNGDDKNKYSDTKFIFTNAQSGTLAYLFENTGIKNPSTENMFALDSLNTFIEYLQKNTNAIGFLQYALISDKDDPLVKETLEKLRIMQVVYTDSTGTRMISELSQSSIATKEYPFVRPINLILGNAPERLGTGFVNFMFKSKPGRIFLKAGLIPAQMPEREIKINTN